LCRAREDKRREEKSREEYKDVAKGSVNFF